MVRAAQPRKQNRRAVNFLLIAVNLQRLQTEDGPWRFSSPTLFLCEGVREDSGRVVVRVGHGSPEPACEHLARNSVGTRHASRYSRRKRRRGRGMRVLEGTDVSFFFAHPGDNSKANPKSIFHRCHPILVAFVLELTQDTMDLPLSCMQGGGELPCAASLRSPPRNLEQANNAH